MKPKISLFVWAFFLIPISSSAQNCDEVEINTRTAVVLPQCNGDNGSIVFIETEGGVPNYTYTLDTSVTQTGAFFNLTIGDYEVFIKDARGCEDTVTVSLSYKDINSLIKPRNAFTPNGDSWNDSWQIPGIESFTGAEVRVFNRWGQQVHVNTAYSNELAWDGTQNGSNLPPATYYYVISLINNCVEEYINGTVTIIR
jgi:gliding motility-associated-like protein